MKLIAYTRPDGGVSVVVPAEGARLALSVDWGDGTESFAPVDDEGKRLPVPVNAIAGVWPKEGKPKIVAEWAETEAAFVARIAAKDVPVTLKAPCYFLTRTSRPVQGLEGVSEAGPGTPPGQLIAVWMLPRAEAIRFGFEAIETPFQIIDSADLPDRTFRNGWTVDGEKIGHDMEKVRVLAHDMRRARREAELQPYDRIVALHVPAENPEAAETVRALIREKYAAMQTAIDQACDTGDVQAVKSALAAA